MVSVHFLQRQSQIAFLVLVNRGFTHLLQTFLFSLAEKLWIFQGAQEGFSPGFQSGFRYLRPCSQSSSFKGVNSDTPLKLWTHLTFAKNEVSWKSRQLSNRARARCWGKHVIFLSPQWCFHIKRKGRLLYASTCGQHSVHLPLAALCDVPGMPPVHGAAGWLLQTCRKSTSIKWLGRDAGRLGFQPVFRQRGCCHAAPWPARTAGCVMVWSALSCEAVLGLDISCFVVDEEICLPVLMSDLLKQVEPITSAIACNVINMPAVMYHPTWLPSSSCLDPFSVDALLNTFCQNAAGNSTAWLHDGYIFCCLKSPCKSSAHTELNVLLFYRWLGRWCIACSAGLCSWMLRSNCTQFPTAVIMMIICRNTVSVWSKLTLHAISHWAGSLTVSSVEH